MMTKDKIVENPQPPTDADQPLNYRIRVWGHLGVQWRSWFDGMVITLEENGETLISGPVIDQAALYGLLKKVRDLGLPLISVNRNSNENSKETKK
jgi:hypothetical protein